MKCAKNTYANVQSGQPPLKKLFIQTQTVSKFASFSSQTKKDQIKENSTFIFEIS